jgi:hypothetical protein
MTTKKKPYSFNYYLLNKYLHPETPRGYRQTVVNVIVNQNTTKERGKFLFIQEKNKWWGLPKQGFDEKLLTDGFIEALSKNIGEELGFKGITVIEIKPKFTQIAYLFDFEKQVFDEDRSEREIEKGNPGEGKIYHLAIMHYKGPDEIPIDKDDPKTTTIDYKWVTKEEGRELEDKNKEISAEEFGDVDRTAKFHVAFFERIMKAYEEIQKIYAQKNPYQNPLL